MKLEGCYGSLQVHICLYLIALDAQSAIIIKGVGKLVAREFYLFGHTHRAVALAAMGNDNESVFAFIQAETGYSKMIVIGSLVDGLDFLFAIKDHKGNSGTYILESCSRSCCLGNFSDSAVLNLVYAHRYVGVCVMC